MLSWFAKVLLTLTAMAPVGLVYAWAAYTQGQPMAAFAFAAASTTLVPISWWLIRYAQRTVEKFSISISEIEPADRENTAFLLLYMLPLFTDRFSTLNWAVWIPILVIFAIMTVSGYNYHFNPLLNIFGWHFYRIQSDGVAYVMITRRHLRSVVGQVEVCQLTEYILLDTKD